MTKTSNKILIIGLGNPGRRYKKTRHNVGFRVIDELVKNYESRIRNHEEKFNASVWEMKINNQKIILAKPLTFMNESGRAVKTIIHNSKFMIQDLIVIHDDIDLPLGTIRVSQDASSAGQKGIQSIIDELRTKDFTRIRIGIRPKFVVDTETFVLKNFTKEEEKIIKQVIKKAMEIIKKSLKEGIKKTTVKI